MTIIREWITKLLKILLSSESVAKKTETTQVKRTPAFTVFRQNKWYGYDYDTMPCQLSPLDWYDNEIKPDTDNRYDYLIIDWQAGHMYQVFTHDKDYHYALKWHSFALGEDGHPHPIGSFYVDCSDMFN